MVRQHESKPPGDLGLVAAGVELSCQADRLGGDVDVAGVALVKIR